MALSGIWAAKVAADIFFVILAFLPSILFKLHVFDPYKRGFFCDDSTLAHPYHDSTISSFLAALLGIGLNVLAIVFIELMHGRHASLHNKGSTQRVYKFGRFTIHQRVVAIYKMVGVLVFGCAVQQSITDIGKYSIGRLRPHFFDACRPNLTNVHCSHDNYIVDVVCTTSDEHKLREMRLSFPSGHSSLAAYCMVFLTLYLQKRFIWHCSVLIRPFLQMAALWFAVGICLSRISDYKHHPTDVLGGAIIGIVTAITVLRCISDLYANADVNIRLAALPEPVHNMPSADMAQTNVSLQNVTSTVPEPYQHLT